MCWNNLKNLYESSNNARRSMFENRLYNINMGEGTNMEKFFLGMKNLQIQIGSISDIMKDEDVVLTILNALPLVLKVLCRALCCGMNYRLLRNFSKNYCKKIIKGHFEGRNIKRMKP